MLLFPPANMYIIRFQCVILSFMHQQRLQHRSKGFWSLYLHFDLQTMKNIFFAFNTTTAISC
eukprot:UN13855